MPEKPEKYASQNRSCNCVGRDLGAYLPFQSALGPFSVHSRPLHCKIAVNCCSARDVLRYFSSNPRQKYSSQIKKAELHIGAPWTGDLFPRLLIRIPDQGIPTIFNSPSRLVDFLWADGRRGSPFSPLSLRCNSLENSTSLSGLPSLAACSATRCQALTGSNSRSTMPGDILGQRLE